MKLLLTIDGAETTVEVLSPARECRFRIGDADIRAADVEIPEPGVYSILMDGRSYEARVEESPSGTLVVFVDGARVEMEARDPRRWSRKSGAVGAHGIQNVTVPMPGKVVRVLVAAGDAIEPGQGMVVVEAMKMQNEVRAPRAGRVLKVSVREGAAVVAGEVLATIE